MESLFHRMGNLFHRMGNLFHRVGNLFHRVGNLFHRVGNLFHRVGNLFHRVGNLFHRIIALMKDQVDSLGKRNISATYINSTLSPEEQRQRMHKVAQGAFKEVSTQIRAVITQIGDVSALAPIKACLPEEINYGQIRCVIEAIKREGLDDLFESDPADLTPSPSPEKRGEPVPPSPSEVPPWIAGLRDPDPQVRSQTILELGRSKETRAVGVLMSLFKRETNPDVRLSIVNALASMGDPKVQPLLGKIAKSETESPLIRAAARLVLHRWEGETPAEPTEAVRSGQWAVEKQGDKGATGQGDPSRLPTAHSLLPEIDDFLNRPHPRPLKGNWHAGWALDLHSCFTGATWSRNPVGGLVYHLKYGLDLSVLQPLLEHVVALLDQHPELKEVDALVPVPPSRSSPMHPVSLLSEALSKRLGLALLPALVKTRQTRPQKDLRTLAQKQANVAGAFKVQGDVKGKRLLLLDDLYDSGATLEEATRVLTQAGTSRICVLTLTRTIHFDG